MDKNQLTTELRQRLSESRYSMRGFTTSREIKPLLIEYTSFLSKDAKLSQRAWHLINEIDHIPLCKHCNLIHPKFNNNKFGYLDFCSIRCQSNSDQVKDNRANTLESKYGEGVINVWQAKEIKDKIKITMNEKYGVDHNSQLEHNKERSSNYFKSDGFKEKCRITFNRKYGVDHYSKTQEFKDKFKETCLLRYGVEHQMQNSEIFDKQMKSAKKYKKYVLPSGKEILIQGYEDRALNLLFSKGFEESDILTSRKDIEDSIGKILYQYKGKNKRYYPDFYIKSTNTIIEVKSTWTLDNNNKLPIEDNINYSKKEACERLGFNFEFYVM